MSELVLPLHLLTLTAAAIVVLFADRDLFEVVYLQHRFINL